MINEYLDIARLESGTQRARFNAVDVATLMDQTLLILEPLAKQKKIKLIRAFMPDPPSISADSEMLGRALTNILANAIKYSPEKTAIKVGIQDEDGALMLTVADSGYGISSDQLPHIFEKFYRIPNPHATDVPGTGLGLSMAREIVDLHGGRIAVESERGVGSTFTITLPHNHNIDE